MKGAMALRISQLCKCAAFLAVCVTIPTLKAAPQVDESSLLRSCEMQISGKFRQWHIAPVTQEVEESAKGANESPTRVFADFDGDGRKDVALLIIEGSNANSGYPQRLELLHIAVCLNAGSDVKLRLIDMPYCGDGITLSRKGAPYYDFETDKEGVYALDGIHAYCFGKAGATYQFESGSFRRIVDDD
jgi:hypothetical protein